MRTQLAPFGAGRDVGCGQRLRAGRRGDRHGRKRRQGGRHAPQGKGEWVALLEGEGSAEEKVCRVQHWASTQ